MIRNTDASVLYIRIFVYIRKEYSNEDRTYVSISIAFRYSISIGVFGLFIFGSSKKTFNKVNLKLKFELIIKINITMKVIKKFFNNFSSKVSIHFQ